MQFPFLKDRLTSALELPIVPSRYYQFNLPNKNILQKIHINILGVKFLSQDKLKIPQCPTFKQDLRPDPIILLA
jgi:hypothetical protein